MIVPVYSVGIISKFLQRKHWPYVVRDRIDHRYVVPHSVCYLFCFWDGSTRILDHPLCLLFALSFHFKSHIIYHLSRYLFSSFSPIFLVPLHNVDICSTSLLRVPFLWKLTPGLPPLPRLVHGRTHHPSSPPSPSVSGPSPLAFSSKILHENTGWFVRSGRRSGPGNENGRTRTTEDSVPCEC